MNLSNFFQLSPLKFGALGFKKISWWPSHKYDKQSVKKYIMNKTTIWLLSLSFLLQCAINTKRWFHAGNKVFTYKFIWNLEYGKLWAIQGFNKKTIERKLVGLYCPHSTSNWESETTRAALCLRRLDRVMV